MPTLFSVTHRLLAPALAAALAGAAGCVGLPSPRGAPDRDHLTISGGGAAHQLKLQGREIYGSRVNVSFLADGYRGMLDNKHVVDLRPAGDDKVVGSVAGGPTELYLADGPAGLRVRGLYRGRVSSFFLTPERFQGLVGDCTYSLRASGPGAPYVGGRACGRGGHGARMTLPAAFYERPARERVVMLALLLGG